MVGFRISKALLTMKQARLWLVIGLLLTAAMELFAWQRYGGGGSNQLQPYDATDQDLPAEFYFSRLRYNAGYGGGGFGYRGFRRGWSEDFPRADHDCLVALRRLTRIYSPAPLNIVDIDDEHILDFPWVYAVGVSNWAFNDAEAARVREYIARGGFLMVDHFHGQDDWNRFMPQFLGKLDCSSITLPLSTEGRVFKTSRLNSGISDQRSRATPSMPEAPAPASE
jgi:hypothetical protein